MDVNVNDSRTNHWICSNLHICLLDLSLRTSTTIDGNRQNRTTKVLRYEDLDLVVVLICEDMRQSAPHAWNAHVDHPRAIIRTGGQFAAQLLHTGAMHGQPTPRPLLRGQIGRAHV